MIQLCPSNLELLPFQQNLGIPHILSRPKSYLAHQPGLGKSAQTICAINTKPGPTLIICPAFLRTTWEREIQKWSTQKSNKIVIMAAAMAFAKIDFDWLIVSDAILHKPDILRELCKKIFRHVVIDEAHRFKTWNSKRSLALFGGRTEKIMSPGLIYKSEHTVALSGTPMLNRPFELWPILFAMAPETIDRMPMINFGYRYCGATRDKYGAMQFLGASQHEELRQRIKPFMQVLKKEDVLPELPPKIRQVVFVDRDLRSAKQKEWDQLLTKDLDLENLPKMSTMGKYAELRHEIGQSKVAWTAEYIEETLKENPEESIIVFAHHRSVVQDLALHLAPFQPLTINGGVSMEARTQMQDLFQLGKRRVIIGNIDSMNLGITLTRATRVIFVEYAWTPALNEQAEDRAHRIGQKDSVYVEYITLASSMDEVILNSVLRKQENIERIIG